MAKIESKRDREVLVNEGFMYIFEKLSADKQKIFGDVAKKMVIWQEFIQLLTI